MSSEGRIVRFRILGPIELSDDRGPVSVGGPRQLALLAFLLVHANRAVSADQLIDALWGGQRAAGAVKRLQVAVARLRKALDRTGPGPQGGSLRTVSGGYLLAVETGALDADVFQARAEEGRRALEEGQPARATEVLREGLALWRGPALAEVTYEAFALGEIQRLEETRLAALEARVDAELQLGRHVALVPELETLATSHPTRERLSWQPMLALYRCGRQRDALEVYQRAHRLLAAELGLTPGPALQQMERAVLSQDAQLDLAVVEPPVAVATDAPLPRLLSMAGRTRFVGRERQMDRLHGALKRATDGDRGVVLLEGEPGIGKTRLAAEFAHLAHGDGALVLYGRCPEETLAAYQPFTESLGHYLATAPPAALRTELGITGGELTRLLPALGRRLPDLPPPSSGDPEGERFRLFEAVDLFLVAAARSRPVVLIVDDLHWADGPSVRLLSYLVRAADPARLLVVAASRDTEPPRTDALGAAITDLKRDGVIDRLELTGLADPEVRELICSSAGTTVAPRVRRAIVERSAGNPFFAGELLRDLQESGLALGSTDADVERLASRLRSSRP